MLTLKQCVPGPSLSSPSKGPGYEAMCIMYKTNLLHIKCTIIELCVYVIIVTTTVTVTVFFIQITKI